MWQYCLEGWWSKKQIGSDIRPCFVWCYVLDKTLALAEMEMAGLCSYANGFAERPVGQSGTVPLIASATYKNKLRQFKTL